jgi:hypothetical protein
MESCVWANLLVGASRSTCRKRVGLIGQVVRVWKKTSWVASEKDATIRTRQAESPQEEEVTERGESEIS